ncbi:DUF6094 domain-containing protein [Paenibacillus sp. Leaf72]|uniref:DUF6094 domain-containing protein n=1 Tax=Paenibacillus sp. Leaf72 TaxID=1736234 RepID=UPI0006FD9953|nr:DUF6094 domain-containing protein [Paenibacillus sp. Leaf72]KQN96854.1 hypothetical protein ASF12_22560 [Paenibacillus sp. Leaf72]
MARLESEAKGGFYPTPEVEMELILKRVKATEGDTVSILDPCAGNGDALKQIQTHLHLFNTKPITYGIEIEKTRAEAAADKIDHVIACGYEESRMSHDAFSMLYLNPPFMKYRGGRAETIFLRDLTMPEGYLSIGSLVILNIPQHVLSDVAKLIASRLEDVKVYRFTDANFDQYEQVIVYGYRKPPGQGSSQEIESEMTALSKVHPSMIPELSYPDWDDIHYVVPAQKREVDIFSTTIVSYENAAIETDFLSRVFAQVEDVHLQTGAIRQPAMPLKITHQVQAIQSGALPEHMGTHLLVAKDESVHTKTIEVDEETGKSKQIEHFKRKSIIRTFTANGHIDLK